MLLNVKVQLIEDQDADFHMQKPIKTKYQMPGDRQTIGFLFFEIPKAQSPMAKVGSMMDTSMKPH